MTTITPGAWLTSNVTGIDFGADQIRTILHLLGVSVWLGGQILMLGLLPVLHELGGEAPKLAAAGFGRVAWPAFGLTIVTGIWNILEVDLADVTSGYNALFGIKMILVVVTGVAAAMHQSTNKPAIRAITGALGFAAALGAFMLGATMSH